MFLGGFPLAGIPVAARGELPQIGSTLAAQEPGDTTNIQAQVHVSASFTLTEVGEDTLTGAAGTLVQGSLVLQEGEADTADFLFGVRSIIANLQETDADTLTVAAQVPVTFSMDLTEPAIDTVALSGRVLAQAGFSVQEANADTHDITANLQVRLSLVLTEASPDALKAGAIVNFLAKIDRADGIIGAPAPIARIGD